MEILRAGTKLEKYYNFNCFKCGALIGANHSELRWQPDYRNGEWCELKCPQCGARVTGDKGNIVAEKDI